MPQNGEWWDDCCQVGEGSMSIGWRLTPIPHPFGTAASHPMPCVWPLPLLWLWAPRDPREALTGAAGPWRKPWVHKAPGLMGRRCLHPGTGCCKAITASWRLQRGRSSLSLTFWGVQGPSFCFPKSRHRRVHRGNAQKGSETLRRGLKA